MEDVFSAEIEEAIEALKVKGEDLMAFLNQVREKHQLPPLKNNVNFGNVNNGEPNKTFLA